MAARPEREIPPSHAQAQRSPRLPAVCLMAPGTRGSRTPAHVRTWANVSAALNVLFIAAMLTLLVACVKCRRADRRAAQDRASEMAIRGSVGDDARARVLRQLLCESLVLVVAGGAFGLYRAMGASRARGDRTGQSPQAGRHRAGWPDPERRAGHHATTGLAVGLAPGLRLSRRDGDSPWYAPPPRMASRSVHIRPCVARALGQVAIAVV
mgnify:CR=1 FL=1